MPPYSAKIVVLSLSVLLTAPFLSTVALAAQVPAPGSAPPVFSIASVRPALANVQTAIADLNIGRWKVPGVARANSQQDVESMQRDLATTLPGLLSEAEVAAATGTGSLSPSFAVFRNLDALYDVLLRVTETAEVAGAGADATNLEAARAGLEESRGKLGAWLTQAINAQDAHLARAQAPAPVAAVPAPPSKIVVNDGPEAAKPHKKKASPAPQ